MGLVLAAPAKVNLFLRVLGRRPDGYHEIESLFAPISLSDRLSLTAMAEPGVRLACPGSGLPEDESNLAFRAAELFLEAAGLQGGLDLTLTKRIPVAAGLGGGSSDAAAALRGANQLFGRPLSESRLEELALRLGADVPFFIRGRPALARGVGQLLEPVEVPPFHLALVNPGFGVSTAWAYARLGRPLTGATPLVRMTGLKVESFSEIAPLGNDLEAVVEEAFPVVRELRLGLLAAGANLARMSGSGPTVFGLFERKDQAERALTLLKPAQDRRSYLVQGPA